jgi:hypothetical protein
MTQKDKGKSSKPSTAQPGSEAKGSEKPPKFPPGVKAIGHGSGGVRTTTEVPNLPRVPRHGGGGIAPSRQKPDGGVE